ncbi:MAG: ABC transporter permease, partial [Candidatus Eremiobacteraeota bacterium]|nr:ABC transporter permease [Candidatus Eremiobacteraeota bacterium]
TLAARTVKFGRALRPEDVAGGSHVVVLSEPLADRFFPSGGAIGQEIRIGGYRFAVVGVYDKLKSALLSNAGGDDYVDVPYTAYHQLAPGPVDDLVYFAPAGRGPEATAAVLAALQRLHGPRAKYQTQDAAAQIGGFNKVLGIIGAGLSSIGGVALLVAGIGIMNIMLVSVTERTREIGIRKAIGASFRDVMLQFLLEAVLLSLMGGIIGMLLGLLIILAAYGPVSSYVGPAPIPYAFIVSLAMIFSLLVGSVFGTYPAYRAAKLDPIEALRS